MKLPSPVTVTLPVVSAAVRVEVDVSVGDVLSPAVAPLVSDSSPPAPALPVWSLTGFSGVCRGLLCQCPLYDLVDLRGVRA
jgi:hypothetical protein